MTTKEISDALNAVEWIDDNVVTIILRDGTKIDLTKSGIAKDVKDIKEHGTP